MANANTTPDDGPAIKPPTTNPNETCKWKTHNTEYLEKYPQPRKRNDPISRDALMSKFLWTELSKAYIERERKRDAAANELATATEYNERYNTEPLDHSKEDEAGQKTYPLYGTEAISYWCPSVRNKTPFKQCHCLTKVNEECYDDQFR